MNLDAYTGQFMLSDSTGIFSAASKMSCSLKSVYAGAIINWLSGSAGGHG